MIDPTTRAAILADMALPGAVAAAVGQKHGVSGSYARGLAKKADIYKPVKRGPKPKTPEDSAEYIKEKYPGIQNLLGKVPDAEAGRQLGVCRERVRQIRNIFGVDRAPKSLISLSPEQKKLLGTMSDAEVAKRLDVSSGFVWKQRNCLGIAPKPLSVFDAYLDLFGQIPDVEIAGRAGVSVSAIANYRQRHPDLPRSKQGRRTKPAKQKPA